MASSVELKTRNRPEDIYQDLRERIVDGAWKVGDRISTEEELAIKYGVSRATVNKAIVRLQHDGLVERRTRAGTRVISNTISRGGPPLALDALAFIYPTDQHEGIWRIAQGFQQGAQAAQRRTMLLSTDTNLRKESEIVGRLSEFDVKGAVVYPVLPEPVDQIYFGQMLLACRFPVVLVEVNLPGFGRPAVVVDGFHAGYTMTRHLLSGGARRIGFLSNYAWTPFIRDRYLGYRQAMEEAHLAMPASGVLLASVMHPNFSDPVAESRDLARQFLVKAGVTPASCLRGGVQEPVPVGRAGGLDAVLCANDFLALGCLEAARELGLAVPERLKVVGIDDYALAAQADPPLTTYHIPYEQMGREAFGILNRLLAAASPAASGPEGQASANLELPLRGELVVRRSA